MKQMNKVILIGAGLSFLVGCQTEGSIFASRQLDATNMNEAMIAAQNIMGQYMPIAAVDPVSHRITAGPVAAEGEALTIVHPAQFRQRGVLRLRREDSSIWADVNVVIEQQQGPQMRTMSPLITGYPKPAPNQEDAPYTYEQNQAWQVVRHNEDMQARILDDLYANLHPEAASQPASQFAE